MTVTEQVDALRAMAISPVRRLVVPRVLATVLMMPVLTAHRRRARHPRRPPDRGRRAPDDGAGLPDAASGNQLAISDIMSGLGKTFFFGLEIAIDRLLQRPAGRGRRGLRRRGDDADRRARLDLRPRLRLLPDEALPGALMSAARPPRATDARARAPIGETIVEFDERLEALQRQRHPGGGQPQDPPRRGPLRPRALGHRQERHAAPHQRPDAARRRRRARLR